MWWELIINKFNTTVTYIWSTILAIIKVIT
jgi:hypothetical protein